MEMVVTEQWRGKSVTLHFSIIYCHGSDRGISQIFNIDDLAKVRFQFAVSGEYLITSLSLRKHADAQDSKVKLDVKSEILKYSQQWTCTEHWIDWQQMGGKECYGVVGKNYLKAIPINITVYEVKSLTAEHFYKDSNFTDFTLSTTDGSVTVHRACLAAHSDVFEMMLSHEWNETAEGRLQIKGLEGVTLQTLQHLKQYMYLGTLPDEGLRPLLQLATCYLIDDLKSACISKLARTVTSVHLEDLIEFAAENKFTELTLAILQLTPENIVNEAYKIKKEKDCENAQKK